MGLGFGLGLILLVVYSWGYSWAKARARARWGWWANVEGSTVEIDIAALWELRGYSWGWAKMTMNSYSTRQGTQ